MMRSTWTATSLIEAKGLVQAALDIEGFYHRIQLLYPARPLAPSVRMHMAPCIRKSGDWISRPTRVGRIRGARNGCICSIGVRATIFELFGDLCFEISPIDAIGYPFRVVVGDCLLDEAVLVVGSCFRRS